MQIFWEILNPSGKCCQWPRIPLTWAISQVNETRALISVEAALTCGVCCFEIGRWGGLATPTKTTATIDGSVTPVWVGVNPWPCGPLRWAETAHPKMNDVKLDCSAQTGTGTLKNHDKDERKKAIEEYNCTWTPQKRAKVWKVYFESERPNSINQRTGWPRSIRTCVIPVEVTLLSPQC